MQGSRMHMQRRMSVERVIPVFYAANSESVLRREQLGAH